MPEKGPDREISDQRLLVEFVLSSDPALFASEIAENVPYTRQRVSQRLDEIEDKEGYVTSKVASGRRLWWLTDKGREYVAKLLRKEFE